MCEANGRGIQAARARAASPGDRHGSGARTVPCAGDLREPVAPHLGVRGLVGRVELVLQELVAPGRGGRGRATREAEALEDLVGRVRWQGHGQHAGAPAAARAFEHVDREHSLQQLGPREASRTRDCRRRAEWVGETEAARRVGRGGRPNRAVT